MIQTKRLKYCLALAAAAAAVTAAAQPHREDAGAGGLIPLAQAQAFTEEALPLRRVSLYSSGVAFFDHQGQIEGACKTVISLPQEAMNDALKSLVVRDPGSSFPQVVYPLAENPEGAPSPEGGLPEILTRMQGAEVRLTLRGASTEKAVTGRILGLESFGLRPLASSRAAPEGRFQDKILSLYTEGGGILRIPLDQIETAAFTDSRIEADLARALDQVLASRQGKRDLTVLLPGDAQNRRQAAVSYLVPAPVWKAVYRLDLGRDPAGLQGWAIVDNGSRRDWQGVELTLVSGRAVSFSQPLYPPYWQRRPALPLSLPGVAEARRYDETWAAALPEAAGLMALAEPPVEDAAPAAGGARNRAAKLAAAPPPQPEPMAETPAAQAEPQLAYSRASQAAEDAAGVGDNFSLTLERPITVAAGQSALVPLFEGTVQARRLLLVSAGEGRKSGPIRAALGLEITNTTEKSLPPGPVTIYENGVYTGDALAGFLRAGEKRFLSYGEDLAVSGAITEEIHSRIGTAVISRGVMTIRRIHLWERTYVLNNRGPARALVVEHPITRNTTLVEPTAFDSRSDGAYRFERTLGEGETLTLTVREERPASEGWALTQLAPARIAAFSENQELPAAVREALSKAAALRIAADKAEEEAGDREGRYKRLVDRQDRIRQNLTAAGGEHYLKQLTDLDGEIDALAAQVEAAKTEARAALAAYRDYLEGLVIE